MISPILQPNTVLLIGEAPGEQEVLLRLPFVGPSGKLLDEALQLAGTARYKVSLTNVFLDRPPNNDLRHWTVKGKTTDASIPVDGGIIDPPRAAAALSRLQEEISRVNPPVIIALGNVPLAALTGERGIGKLRGALLRCRLSNRPLIATYHPAAVLRQYDLMPTMVADIAKALRFSRGEIVERERKLWLVDKVSDFPAVEARLSAAEIIAFDAETRAGQITCIGFSPAPEEAYVVPFWGVDKPHFWSLDEEVLAVQAVKRIMESDVPKVAQNGIYDLQYLYRYGIRPRNFQHDTMLYHHALFPALPKGLDYLGSLYTAIGPWKLLRPRGLEVLKREE